ncbi:sulfatase-like hydrolase/transferase [Modicisalibacter sp. 'Wilcox']|uniref:sulfatase-like hydrolase/transferase n=1 Tax=Modicisalibacter sp. 'Wilcox' TaxID=2679914 RepID=UPI0013D88B84|nr:sulfatase-like hydrolase/transferase [Modicisalibacter sp. 'Wilcox']
MSIRLPARRWWALGYLGLCIGYTATTVLALRHAWTLAALLLWLGLAWLFRWGDPPHARRVANARPWSLLPLALWWIYLYLADTFGKVDVGAVVFHLQAGIGENGSGERIIAAVVYTLAGLVMLAAVTWLVRADHRWRLLERPLVLFLLAFNPLLFGLTLQGASIVADDGAWLERRYTPPRLAASPADPPDLIYLYLESTEATYADRARFGDAYADLRALGESGLVFHGIRQLDNTGWTMAGMIASQCGTPLMPAGLMHDSQFEPLEHVVPGIDCLGDLLADQGYRLTFMGGASNQFAGKGLYYREHGFDTVLGRDTLRRRLADPDYLNSWGLYDDSLLDLATERIREMKAQPQPFGLFAITLAAHPPYGHPARACRERQGTFDGEDILYSVKCTGWLARRFVERLRREGLLDDTLVVVASDHLSMKNSAWQSLIAGPRENTLMLFGDGIRPGTVRREASMVDVLPTLLEAMGFTLPTHRAGLGASLLSPARTLVERHGVEPLNERLRAERALQRRLWQTPSTESP